MRILWHFRLAAVGSSIVAATFLSMAASSSRADEAPAKPKITIRKLAPAEKTDAAAKAKGATKSGDAKKTETRVIEAAAAAAEHAVPQSIRDAAATHKQSLIIKINGEGKPAKLEDFCIAADGNVLALVSPQPARAGGGLLGLLSGEADAPAKKGEPEKVVESSVRVFDAAGKQASEWPVGFLAQAINTAPGGSIVVGGNGKVARFEVAGKLLHAGDSPQMEYIRKNAEEMRERAKEQIASQKEMVLQNVKAYEEQLKQFEAKKEEDLTAQEKAQKTLFARQVKMMQTYAEQVGKTTVEQAVKDVTDRALKTHSICASDKDVFIVCPAMAGYGFGVWRTTVGFTEPKEIVKSLSGCCGQMDVQCQGGELFVAENSRHRVIRYDRDGKQVATFGKRDRDGEGEGFGSCCNPMNTCFTSSGDLFVSESNGVVKHFTPDGKYVGVVGVAKVTPGCKNSAIGITADNSRLYYIDITKSEIILLAKEEK